MKEQAFTVSRSEPYSPRRPGRSSFCALPLDRVDVYPDGHIASCIDGHTIGNVLTGTIRDAWNSPERQRLLALLAKEKVLPMCFRCCGISYKIKFDETAVAYENLVQLR